MDLGNLGVIEDVSRSPLPTISTIEKKVLGADGSLYKSNSFAPLDIQASIRLFNFSDYTIDKKINELMELVYSKEMKALNYKNKRTWYDAILVSIEDFERYRNSYAHLTLVFRAPYPLARSEYRIDRYKNFTDEVIEMNGACASEGIFTFTGDRNKITNMRTGEFIEITDGTSQNFIIDCEKNLVKIGSNRAMERLSPYSDFFKIRPGDRIKAEKPVSLEYYERYLYDR